jgi:hypothetical protein
LLLFHSCFDGAVVRWIFCVGKSGRGIGMAGHTDIFPKNEFCRTNAYGLINQVLSLFHKTISSWSISWRPTIYIHSKTLNL